MKHFRLIAIIAIMAMLTGALAILTMGCDEKKDDNSSLILLMALVGEGPKRMFITAAVPDGNLGGAAGADALCMSDANKPIDSSTWKALLTSADRSTTTDWVLKPNTGYIRVDGTAIGTTDANAVFTFPLENPTRPTGGLDQNYWTGLDGDWTNATNNCNNWTTGDGGTSGGIGINFATDLSSISNGDITCSAGNHILCVEQ